MFARWVGALSCALLAMGAYALPPGAEGAKAAVDGSPRHGEFVYQDLADGQTKLRMWVSYPEVAEKAPVVIVIHEIFGFTDWVQSVADAFAAEGFIAIAPDLISGMEGAEENPRETIGKLTPEEAAARLNVVFDYGKAIPAGNGKIGCVGFCWGGKTTFHYATVKPDLGAAAVYYGNSPETAALAAINAPVLGLYGSDDARVNATIPDAEAEMKRLEKFYEVNLYDAAGHGFLRQQDGREGANMAASEKAWARTVAFFKEHLK